MDADFSNKSDEAHLHFDGFINTQNCCIWDSENPHVSKKTSSMCGFWAGDITGPYLFEKAGQAMSVGCQTRKM